MPRQKKAKFVPKKKKTLTAEPKWESLSKAKTEEKRYEAWKTCDEYVHFELTDKELLHSLRKWIKLESGWNLEEEVNVIPDTFLLTFAKNGWKAIRLGWMPDKVRDTLESELKPLLQRAFELKNKVTPSEPIDVATLDQEYWLHPDKVKVWLKKWKTFLNESKGWEDNKDPNLRMQYQIGKTYVYNMNIYLRTGFWGDDHFGENREGKVITVCKCPAYDADGMIKRNVGTYYPDIGAVWKGNIECN